MGSDIDTKAILDEVKPLRHTSPGCVPQGFHLAGMRDCNVIHLGHFSCVPNSVQQDVLQ